MTDTTCPTQTTTLERVRYFPRQLILADDMLAEQQYFRQKLRRHNRFLHGWGVVCGLGVTAAVDTPVPPATKPKWPWRVKIDAGYAVGPWGDEIYVPEPVCLDLTKCLASALDPCDPTAPPHVVPMEKLFVAIRYRDCETRPVRVQPMGCDCDDITCEYSRVRDGFEISCLAEPPANDPLPNLCELLAKKELPPCPPCPESPWVVLAEVTLPKQPATPVDDKSIDNFVRRLLVSTGVLQAQLIDCCCAPPRELADVGVEVDTIGDVNQQVIFTFAVTNHGPSTAKNVILRHDTPPSAKFAQNTFVPPGAWTISGNTIEAKLNDLAPGQVVQLKAGVRNPIGTHQTTVTSDTTDPDLSNNKVTKTIQQPPIL